MLTRLFITLGLFLSFAAAPITGHLDDQPRSLRHINGENADWNHYLGQNKWLLVKVWAANCVVCNETVHEIVALQEQRGDKDLLILGIALSNGDDLDEVKRYISRHQLTFQNLLDNGSSVAHIYESSTGEAWGGWTPTFLLYNPQGGIAAKNIGPIRAEDITRFIDNYTG